MLMRWVASYPNTTFAAESPTSMISTPASANATAVQEIANAQAVAKLTGEEANLESIGAKMTPPDSKVFAAMVAIVGRLTGIGEAAEELDVTDLQEIAAKALSTGEAPGRGGAETGVA